MTLLKNPVILTVWAVGLCFIFSLAASSSWAQQVISYQGTVTMNGTPMNGPHNVALAIYADSNGGAALYQESQYGVNFSDGVFNVEIGSKKTNPLPMFDAGSMNGSQRTAPDYFLGITIDPPNTELTPRSKLGATPTAFSSRFADSARTASTAITATTALNLAPSGGGAVISVNTLSGPVTLTGQGGTTINPGPSNSLIISSTGGGGTGIQGIQNTDGTLTIANPNGPTATIGLAVLSTRGTANLFAGVGAGTKNTTGTGNTFLGKSAGYSNQTGSENTFSGDSAGFFNTGSFNTFTGVRAGVANTASGNTFLGYLTGESNTTGSANTFTGDAAGLNNINGNNNTFTGSGSGYLNNTGVDNTFTGVNAGLLTDANGNTFFGYTAGATNQTGSDNTAIGDGADMSSAAWSNSTAIGYNAQAGASNTIQLGNSSVTAVVTNGSYNTTGGGLQTNSVTRIDNSGNLSNIGTIGASGNINTGFGTFQIGGLDVLSNDCTGNLFVGDVGYDIPLGSNNTAIGDGASVYNSGTNSMAIGNGAIVRASNHVVIGNTSVTSIGGYANWSNISDGRFKKNVKSNVPGLEFMSLLNPITYNLDIRGLNNRARVTTSNIDESGIQSKERIVYSGFIAQDVESAAASIGYDFDGVSKPQSDQDHYTLAYASFVPSLVKSVQELNAMIVSQQAVISKLQSELERLKSTIK